MKPQVRTLNDIRIEYPKHAEAFDDLIKAHSNVAAQLATDPNGAQITPTAPANLMVQEQNGFVDLAIVDNSPISRAINYYVEWADNPGFNGYRTTPLGPSRNGHVMLPNGTFYFRVRSQYPAGGPATQPVAAASGIVIASSVVGTFSLFSSQGSGTGGGGAGSTITRK